MKKVTCICTLAVLLMFFCISACRKTGELSYTNPNGTTSGTKPDSTSTKDTSTSSVVVPFPKTPVTQCSGAPNYGDSIIYLQPVAGDYIVRPLNNPDTGKYFSWPVGMVLDKNTGAINVSRSENGLRYNIGYVRKGTTDTCMQTIILAGASYPDSVFVLANGEQFELPYFNANPNLISICSGQTTGGITCMFDIDNNATNKHISIDHNTGVIDLKKTLNQGAFGLLPLDGTTISTTIAYKLNDNSSMAMQHIPVNMIYYTRKQDVPASLLAAVEDKLNKVTQSLLLINLIATPDRGNTGNPRPPIIIVTRFD